METGAREVEYWSFARASQTGAVRTVQEGILVSLTSAATEIKGLTPPGNLAVDASWRANERSYVIIALTSQTIFYFD
jgi:hypothetical protein